MLTKEYLIEEYINKERFAKDIAKEIGCCDATLTKYFKKFNIKTRRGGQRVKTNNLKKTLEEDLKIMSPKEIAKKHGVCQETIKKYARKYKIFYTKHKINHDFFKTWSPEMAYIVGFLTGDGSITSGKNRYVLSLELNIKDKNHLQKILNIMYPEGKLYDQKHLSKKYNKIYYSSCMKLSSKIMLEDIAKLGVFPKKTGKHRINFDIPEEFLRDYTRGFFDADGTVSLRDNRIYSSFCCKSIGFLEDLKKLLVLSHKNIIIDKFNVGKIDLGVSDSLILYKFMYYKDCICLNRKKEKFNDYLKTNKKYSNKDFNNFVLNYRKKYG